VLEGVYLVIEVDESTAGNTGECSIINEYLYLQTADDGRANCSSLHVLCI
jgi:hypothetical protein